MSVNKYRPHVLVLPEDDANRQLATGFSLHEAVATRTIQVLPEAGGWTQVLEDFFSDHATAMDQYPHRLMVLLIDCDGDDNRLQRARSRVPHHLVGRVFILGTLSEPEALKADLGTYETIGKGMATDCREGTNHIWGHPLLSHNGAELERLRPQILPILFQLP